MSRWNRIALLGVAVVIAAVGGTWAARLHSASDALHSHRNFFPELHATHLDFGSVWETDLFEWSVALTNSSDRIVELSGIAGTCDCTVVEPGSLTLAPGGSGEIKLKIDLRPKPCDPSGAASRPFNVSIRATASSGARKGTVAWAVLGSVKRPVHVPPIDFGRQSDRTPVVIPAVVPILSRAELSDLAVESTAPWFAATIRSSKTGRELVVAPRSGLAREVYRGTLTLVPKSAEGGKFAPLSVPVSLEIAPDLEAVPDRVNFGAREVGSEHTEILSVRSLSGRSLIIDRVESSNPLHLTAELDGEACRVRIRVVGPGVFSETLLIFARPEDGPPESVSVPIRGHGITPNAGARP